MRKKLARTNLGQLRYASHADDADEREATGAIGFGERYFALIVGVDDRTGAYTLDDLGLTISEPDPPYPFIYVGESEILIAEANQVIAEADQMFSEHPERDRYMLLGDVVGFHLTIDTDRMSVAINREYYHSPAKRKIIKRKRPLTIEEAKAFIVESCGGVKPYDPNDDLVDDSDDTTANLKTLESQGV